jgi:alpha/beta superfamily hydrolase
MSPPHELLWIETPGGYLAASFHPAARSHARTPLSPAVLMCHGFTGHRGEAHFLFVQAARAFAQAGIAALRFDFRGSGESDGRFQEMTFEAEVADALAAFDYLAARPEVDPHRVAVLGLSLGGAVAACVAGREKRVAALVLWAAVADLGALAARFQTEQPPPRLPDGTYEWGGLALGQEFVNTIALAQPLREVETFHGPVLIIHGTQDQAVDVSHAHRYAGVLEKRARLHLVDEADHVFSSVSWKNEVIAVTTDFLSQALSGA